MSSSNLTTLQRLHRLNKSSPGFHNQLNDVLFGEEYWQSVPNLQGNDLVLFVDYLDKVCHSILFPRPSLKLDAGSQYSRSCLSRFPYI